MHFIILQGISFRLMYKLAWQKIETHKTLSHGLCGPYNRQLTPQAPKSAVIYILDHGIGAQIWTQALKLLPGQFLFQISIYGSYCQKNHVTKPISVNFGWNQAKLGRTSLEAIFGNFLGFSGFENFNGIVHGIILNIMVAFPASKCQQK